jgi:L-lactate dehydrogenase (cytochrome)
VLLGRPYVYGLGLAGEEGVRHVLRCFLAELEPSLALSGAARIADVDRGMLVRSRSS